MGNVYEDTQTLNSFSQSRALFSLAPKMVAVPEDAEDAAKIFRFVDKLNGQMIRYEKEGKIKKAQILNVSIYGSGRDATGADLTDGIVLSTEKINQFKEFDPEGRSLRVGAGITLGQVNAILNNYGMEIPINAHPDETIGGIIASSTTDPKTLQHNGIFEFVERLEVVLPSGEIIQTDSINLKKIIKKNNKNTENIISKKIFDLIKKENKLITELKGTRYAPVGYRPSTQCIQGKKIDLKPIFFGSQGTLGLITEVILKCTLQPTKHKRIMVASSNLDSILEYLTQAKKFHPTYIDFFDMRHFAAAANLGKSIPFLPPKIHNGYLAVVDFKSRNFLVTQKTNRLLKNKSKNIFIISENKSKGVDFSFIDQAMLISLKANKKSEKITLFEDFYLPAKSLPDFLSKLKEIEHTEKIELPLFGSFLTGNYSLRPEIKEEDLDKADILVLAKKLSNIVHAANGSLVGAKAEGQIKGLFIAKNMSESEILFYKKIKSIFDPNGFLGMKNKPNLNPKPTIGHIRTTISEKLKD